MIPPIRRFARSALVLLAAALPHPAARVAHASDLAPGDPPLTGTLVDLKRDAVEEVFGFQMTAAQIAEHRRLYARCWKYAPAAWQKAEAAVLPEFSDLTGKSADARRALREKHRAAWQADAKDRVARGNPYFQWLVAQTEAAARVAAAGDPPLRQDGLNAYVEFIDWGLDLQLSPTQRAELSALVAREWMKSFSPTDRTALGEQILPLHRKVVRMPTTERDAVRAKLTAALLPVLEKSETPTDRWLKAAHQSSHQVLDPTAPALTAAVAAGGEEFFEWALGAKLSPEVRRRYREDIARMWKGLSEVDRKAVVRTAEVMRTPPTGAAGELQRARDRAGILISAAWHPDDPFSIALLAAYRSARPATDGPAVPPKGKVLMAGEPPLTEGAADAARYYYEWVLGIEFTSAERAAFRETQLAEWRRKDADAMRGTIEVARFWAETAAFPTGDRELIRATLRPQLIDGCRQTKDTDPGNRWLLALYEAKKPAAKDRPWLTPDLPEAAAELLTFQATEASGQPASAAAVQKAVAAAVTAGSFELSQAPVRLAELRAVWAGLTETAKQELRDDWSDRLAPLTLTAKLAAWQTTPAKPRIDDFLAAQKKLYQQQQQTQMISNMLRMQHQSNMTIIRNMGSTPYKYEYRYVPRR